MICSSFNRLPVVNPFFFSRFASRPLLQIALSLCERVLRRPFNVYPLPGSALSFWLLLLLLLLFFGLAGASSRAFGRFRFPGLQPRASPFQLPLLSYYAYYVLPSHTRLSPLLSSRLPLFLLPVSPSSSSFGDFDGAEIKTRHRGAPNLRVSFYPSSSKSLLPQRPENPCKTRRNITRKFLGNR